MQCFNATSKTALMTVTVAHKKFAEPSFRQTFEVSDDLPAENIGEGVAQVIHQALRSGLDPVTEMNITIHFR